MQTKAVILAKGAPNRCRDGSTTMCAIALSEELGLIRIYPLSVIGDRDVKIWSIAVLTLRRSNTDNREESYRVESAEVVGSVVSNDDKGQMLNQCVLQSGYQDPIDFQNENKRSIAIVKSGVNVGASLVAREDTLDIIAGSDEDGFAMTQSEYPFKPYIEWTSIQGKRHKSHLVGQEVYFGMLNNSSTPFRIFENMRIGDPDYEHWLILGNMKDRRNVWVIPHIHRQKKTCQASMFTNSAIRDGKGNGWPYLTQGERNVKDADPQQTFNFIT